MDPSAPFPRRVAITSANWVATRQRGMAFGILLAAAIMTLFRRLGRAQLRGSFANTALGVVLGAPLGVCVNCAAPIARGMHASGTRLETTLAAMISSPTLNFVVLAMIFSLLPFELAVVKAGTGLAFVLAGIPILCRLVFHGEQLASPGALAGNTTRLTRDADAALFEASGGWLAASRWLVAHGGGYLSLDPPRLHFGLGEHRRVARVEIHWSTGETTALEGAFESGYRYRIRRRPR